jgi:hypothetical protein
VPLDYDRPRGAKISLALTRLPAADPARRVGSIFFKPGGPGGSGVAFVQGAGPFLYSDFETTEDALAAVASFAFPVTRQEERVWVQADQA